MMCANKSRPQTLLVRYQTGVRSRLIYLDSVVCFSKSKASQLSMGQGECPH